MEKLLALIKQNKLPIAVFTGVLILLTLLYIFFAFIGSGETEIPEGSVDQPIPVTDGKEVEFNDDTTFTNFEPGRVASAPVYNIEVENKFNTVRAFLTGIGKGFMRLEEYEDVVYYWRDYPEDEVYIVEYNAITDRVYFRFESAVDVNVGDGRYLRTEDLENYFHQYVSTYWDASYRYTDFNISRQGTGYRIEASRLIGSYPLQISGFEEFSDYIVIEDDGDLIEGQIYLVNIDLESAENVSLIEAATLGALINSDEYPKDFYQLAPDDLDYTLIFGQPYSPIDSSLGDPPPTVNQGEIPELESCVAERVTLVYIYLSTHYERLTPAYRVNCVGQIEFRGESYRTEAILFTNAIDPDLVYVPGGLEVEE